MRSGDPSPFTSNLLAGIDSRASDRLTQHMTNDLRELGDPGSDNFHLEAYPFYLLNRAVSRYNTVIEAALRRIAIDIPTWRVLMILGEAEPKPIAQVAKSAVINISTMARIVGRMIEADLIQTVPSRSDGRVTEIMLTRLGRQRLSAARKITAPVYRQLILGISARKFELLLDLLNRLHDNLESPAASGIEAPLRGEEEHIPAVSKRGRSRNSSVRVRKARPIGKTFRRTRAR